MDLHERLRRPDWPILRQRIWKRDKYTCQVCFRKDCGPLQANHTTYARLGHERDSDLVTVGKPCHRKGTYTHTMIQHDQQAYFWLRVIEWLCFAPFRLVRFLYRRWTRS